MSEAVAFIQTQPQLSVPVPNPFRNAKHGTKSAIPAFPTPALAINSRNAVSRPFCPLPQKSLANNVLQGLIFDQLLLHNGM